MLGAVVRQAAERFGDRTCYVGPADQGPSGPTERGTQGGGSSITYRQLDQLADEVAVGLARRGVSEGDVVALALPSTPEYVVAYVAAARIGAITAGVNMRLSPVEREAVLAAAEPKLVLDRPDAVLGDLRVRGEAPPPLPDDPDRPVAIIFTSGTTGLPKGALFANRQLRFITHVDTADIWADPASPPSHTYGATTFAHLGPMTKLPGVLMRGGTTHLLSRWRPGDALALIEAHRMASFGGIPTQLALMLRHPDFARTDVSSVQAIVIGGGPATPALVREGRERFGAAIAVRYSCTEAGIGVGTKFDDPPDDAEETVGRPHPGVELTVRADDGAVLPTGEEGEVCLRSLAVMCGYWRNEAATADAMWPDGAVRTGDRGWIDDRSRLHLVGRLKEMYVRGGYNVYPMEVETVLASHPELADVAIVPRPDDVWGEIGVAVVVPRDAAIPSLDDLRSFAGQRLASYKLPEDVVVVEALPLTPAEKVDRRGLAQAVVRRRSAT